MKSSQRAARNDSRDTVRLRTLVGVILADTSAWVEFDRATGSPTHIRLRELIESGAGLSVTEPVIMEVLAGARDEGGLIALERLLHRFDLLHFDTGDFRAAVRIYRRCRQAGITPRSMIDCMIASVAWRCGASLLARDADLIRVAKVMNISLDTASELV